MVYQKGTLNGFDILENSTSTGVPVEDVPGDGGDSILGILAMVAYNRSYIAAGGDYIGTIVAMPSGRRDVPASDTDAARGTALATAITAFNSSSDTRLLLSRNHIYDTSSALTITVSRQCTIEGGTLLANSGSDLTYLLKVNNNGTAEDAVVIKQMVLDHNNAVNTNGPGDTFYAAGTGPVKLKDSIVKNGAHKDNTDDENPSNDGSLIRLEGTGIKELENVLSIDAAYSTWRNHARVARFRNFWSICVTKKDGAYQRHGYADSQAQNVHMLEISWDGGGWIDTVTHKVNMNLDPSNDDVATLEELNLSNLLFDISVNHTNPDGDGFFKPDNIRHVNMSQCVQRHSNIDTISLGSTVDQTNTTSLETFIKVGTCEHVSIKNCRFDGQIAGLGTSRQCQVLTVEDSVIGENADNYEAVANCAHFKTIYWRRNRVRNVVGRTASQFAIFDCDGYTSDNRIFLEGRNYFHTNFPVTSGQTAALFRFTGSYVPELGTVGVDPIDQDYEAGSMTWVQAFGEEARLAVTAYPSDPFTLHLGRNVKRGGALRAIGSGSGIYTVTQQQPGTGPDYFPDIDGVAGGKIINDDPSNGAAELYVWDGSQWVLPWRNYATVIDADGATLTAAQSGNVISNEGATGEANFTLPTARTGLRYTFVCQDADGIKATAASGDTIRVAASATPAAGNVSTTTVGNVITLHAINATEWIAIETVGTWTVST